MPLKKVRPAAGTAISAQKPVGGKKTSHAKKTGASVQQTSGLMRMRRLYPAEP